MGLTRRSLALASTMLFALAAAVPARAAEPVKNVVIVHGALADGSGWRKVHDLLIAKGLNVSIVQPPMTTLEADVSAAKRMLDLQDGPSVLVGHSYGGMIITEAGNADNVASLVYVAAFQPDAGENLLELAGRTPAATTGIKPTSDEFLYLDPKVYAADFAADLPAADARFMANSQVLPSKVAFETRIKQPAWKTKKSWALIATADRAINPDLMRTMAKRAASTTVEVKSSHAVFMSQPQAVADLIEKASKAAAD